MPKISIFGRGLRPEQVSDLQNLIAEAGVPDVPVEVLGTISGDTSDDEHVVVIILGTSATCLDPDLEADLIRCQASAKRAVWVWPADSADVERPPAARKYCYPFVSWDAQKLRAAIADGDVFVSERPDGTPYEGVETERNMCVDDDDEKKKKKKKK